MEDFYTVQGQGFAKINNGANNINVTLSGVAATAVTSSYAGQKTLTITGSGFDSVEPENNRVLVCNEPCEIQTATVS